MRIVLFVVILAVACSSVSADNDVLSLRITEFLPDPLGTDDDLSPKGEWVELYNPTLVSIDARGLILYDQHPDNELPVSDTTAPSGTMVPALGYITVYRNGDTDFALNNDGYDEVRLFNSSDNGTLIDRVTYSGSSEGMSWSNLAGIWRKTIPTPGTGNLAKGNCDWAIDVTPNARIFSDRNTIGWNVTVHKLYGPTIALSALGAVEDGFGRVISDYKPWTNETLAGTRTTRYSPNLKGDIFLLKFNISQLDCVDDDLSNNFADELIVMNPGFKRFSPFVEIKEIQGLHKDIATWGSIIRPRLAIYSPNDSQSIETWVEDKNGKKVSKVSQLRITDAFVNFTADVPIALPENCDGSFADGRHIVVADGFGMRKEYDIDIEENPCDGSSSFSMDFFSPVTAGSSFDVRVVTASNVDGKADIWAYVYRGPKSYSGMREWNRRSIRFKKGTDTFVLPVTIDAGTEAGIYGVKVKILKDGRKTAIEEEKEISVVAGALNTISLDTAELVDSENESETTVNMSRIWEYKYRPGTVVYQSSDDRARALAPWLFVGSLVILCVGLVLRLV